MNKIIILCVVLCAVALAESLKCGNEGEMCAGFAGIQCCSGQGLRCYASDEDKKIADHSGKCVKGCGLKDEECGGFAGHACCEMSNGHAMKCHYKAGTDLGKCVEQ